MPGKRRVKALPTCGFQGGTDMDREKRSCRQDEEQAGCGGISGGTLWQ